MNNGILLWEFALALEAVIILNQQRAAGVSHPQSKKMLVWFMMNKSEEKVKGRKKNWRAGEMLVISLRDQWLFVFAN